MNKIRPLIKLAWARLAGGRMYHIDVEWCDEDKVFIASSDDIDGLIVEALSLAEMVESLQEIVPALLEANGQIADYEAGQSFDFNVRLNAPLLQLGAASAQPA